MVFWHNHSNSFSVTKKSSTFSEDYSVTRETFPTVNKHLRQGQPWPWTFCSFPNPHHCYMKDSLLGSLLVKDLFLCCNVQVGERCIEQVQVCIFIYSPTVKNKQTIFISNQRAQRQQKTVAQCEDNKVLQKVNIVKEWKKVTGVVWGEATCLQSAKRKQGFYWKKQTLSGMAEINIQAVTTNQ